MLTTSFVMTAFRFAALSKYPPTSFSSVMTADALMSGSNMKSLPKSESGIEQCAPSPSKALHISTTGSGEVSPGKNDEGILQEIHREEKQVSERTDILGVCTDR